MGDWEEAFGSDVNNGGETGGVTGEEDRKAAPAEQQAAEEEPRETEAGAETAGEGSGGEDSGTEDSGDDKPPKQTPEQDAAFAKMRRENEELTRKTRELDNWVAQNFGASHGIRTWDQYQNAVAQSRQQEEAQRGHLQQQQQQQQLSQIYQNVKQRWIDQGYNEVIADSQAKNEVRIAQQQMQLQELQNNMQRQQSNLMQQNKQQQMVQKIESDHAALVGKYGDMVPTMEQLAQDPNFVALLKSGYSLKAAWLELNADSLLKNAGAAAKQKALNDSKSKAHLKPENSSGGSPDTTVVPPDIMRNYKAMMPDATEKEIRAHYKKSHPRRKR